MAPLLVQNLTYHIPYGRCILEDINFELEQGKFLGVLGKNGSGKTTLIELILGVRNPSAGKILVMGEDPNQESRVHAESVAYLSHDAIIKPSFTIDQFFQFQRIFYSRYSKELEAKYLDFMDLDSKLKIGSLSTGVQKKVAIIAALASRPDLLIIDEITAVLDPGARNDLYTILKEQRDDYGLSVLLATNIADDLIDIVDELIFIKKMRSRLYPASKIPELFMKEAS